jgi:hypothetical protein
VVIGMGIGWGYGTWVGEGLDLSGLGIVYHGVRWCTQYCVARCEEVKRITETG